MKIFSHNALDIGKLLGKVSQVSRRHLRLFGPF